MSLGWIAALGMAALLSSCAAPTATPFSAPPPALPQSGSPSRLAPPAVPPGQLTPVLPSTDLAVGSDQRFLIGLLGADNRLIADAAVDLSFFKVTGPGTAELRGVASTQYHESPSLPGRGVYVTRTRFNEPGDWGVVALVTRPAGEPAEVRVGFQVKERSSTPTVGEPSPRSRTLTGTTAAEIERFSSARPPNPAFYQLSVADALAQEKPLFLLFATPGYCSSLTCGPSLDVLEAFHRQYARDANFIHVEIYKDGRPNEQREVVPAVVEWGLTSEPWLFIVGSDGRLVDKFEGSITLEEVGPVAADLLEV